MRELEKYQTQGEQLQRQVLNYLIVTARDTEYGRQHGFATIKGYDDFVKLNPVNTYEELKGSIDRKLNVVMTRARQQLLMTGSASVLQQNPLFRRLISEYL